MAKRPPVPRKSDKNAPRHQEGEKPELTGGYAEENPKSRQRLHERNPQQEVKQDSGPRRGGA